MITAEQLKEISPGTPITTCRVYSDLISKHCPRYGIDTPIELASFLAQVLHESGGFKWLREIWGPTSAQLRYEGRKDLGNVIKGDGKKFMGRGPIQITGRANYERMSKAMFNDNRLLHNPDILSTPEYGIISSCIYWSWRRMDRIDDDHSIKEETKAVNGGYNGLEDRQRYFDRACMVLNIKP